MSAPEESCLSCAIQMFVLLLLLLLLYSTVLIYNSAINTTHLSKLCSLFVLECHSGLIPLLCRYVQIYLQIYHISCKYEWDAQDYATNLNLCNETNV